MSEYEALGRRYGTNSFLIKDEWKPETRKPRAQYCPATNSVMPHAGDRGTSTIFNGKRTVSGVCIYCGETVIAQEPLYNTVLAPKRKYQLLLPSGAWRCPITMLEHNPAYDVNGGVTCIDCYQPLTHYQFRDNLTGQENTVFLYEYRIEEDPV